MATGPAPHFPMEERVARFRWFYKRTNEGPLPGFFEGSDYPLRRYRASKTLPSGLAIITVANSHGEAGEIWDCCFS